MGYSSLYFLIIGVGESEVAAFLVHGVSHELLRIVYMALRSFDTRLCFSTDIFI